MRSVRHPDAARLLRELRLRRIQLGMSQATIGGQLGLDQRSVSDLERGRWSTCCLGTIIRYAEALDLKIRFEMRMN